MGELNEQLARDAASTGIRRAVETGTLWGNGAMRLSAIFERVETIERSRYYALRAWFRLRRRGYRNVRVWLGDSSKLLRPSTEPTLYWLDGHWTGPSNTAGEHRQCPLLDELRATSPGTVGDWYLIDDACLFTRPVAPPFDPNQWPTLEQIHAVVTEARPGYEVLVREDLDLIIARPQSHTA
jgi:hypothetical protein